MSSENFTQTFPQTFEKNGNVCIQCQYTKNSLHNLDLLPKILR